MQHDEDRPPPPPPGGIGWYAAGPPVIPWPHPGQVGPCPYPAGPLPPEVVPPGRKTGIVLAWTSPVALAAGFLLWLLALVGGFFVLLEQASAPDRPAQSAGGAAALAGLGCAAWLIALVGSGVGGVRGSGGGQIACWTTFGFTVCATPVVFLVLSLI